MEFEHNLTIDKIVKNFWSRWGICNKISLSWFFRRWTSIRSWAFHWSL